MNKSSEKFKKSKSTLITIGIIFVLLFCGLIIAGWFLYSKVERSHSNYNKSNVDSLIHSLPTPVQKLLIDNDTIPLCSEQFSFNSMSRDIEILKPGTEYLDTVYHFIWMKWKSKWSLSGCDVYKGSIKEGYTANLNLLYVDNSQWIINSWDTVKYNAAGKITAKLSSNGRKEFIDYPDKDKEIYINFIPESSDEKYIVERNSKTGKILSEKRFVNIKMSGEPEWNMESLMEYKYSSNSVEKSTYKPGDSDGQLKKVIWDKDFAVNDTVSIYKSFIVDSNGKQFITDSIYQLKGKSLNVKNFYQFSKDDGKVVYESIDSMIIGNMEYRGFQKITDFKKTSKIIGARWIKQTDSLNRAIRIYEENWRGGSNKFVPSVLRDYFYSDSSEIRTEKNLYPTNDGSKKPLPNDRSLYSRIEVKLTIDSLNWCEVYLSGHTINACYYVEGIKMVRKMPEKESIEIVVFE